MFTGSELNTIVDRLSHAFYSQLKPFVSPKTLIEEQNRSWVSFTSLKVTRFPPLTDLTQVSPPDQVLFS